jgi:hypothetical protein
MKIRMHDSLTQCTYRSRGVLPIYAVACAHTGLARNLGGDAPPNQVSDAPLAAKQIPRPHDLDELRLVVRPRLRQRLDTKRA